MAALQQRFIAGGRAMKAFCIWKSWAAALAALSIAETCPVLIAQEGTAPAPGGFVDILVDRQIPSDLLPPEIQGVQQALGGSLVDQVPRFRPENEISSTPITSAGARGERHRRELVEALRDAAWQLETAANRLERLELYRQADALREQAQRLRLDARGMIHPSELGDGAVQRPPQAWVQPEASRTPQPELAPSAEAPSEPGAPRPR